MPHQQQKQQAGRQQAAKPVAGPTAPSRRAGLRRVVIALEPVFLALAAVTAFGHGLIYRYFEFQVLMYTPTVWLLVLIGLWFVRTVVLAETLGELRQQAGVLLWVLVAVVVVHGADALYLRFDERAADLKWTGDIPREEFKPVGSELRYPGANLILISIDTLRADHLGCYGYREDTSPNIDEFARTALQFQRVHAPVSLTLPSHASLFTSLNPGTHHAEVERSIPLPREVTTLAEALQDAGYRTAAVVDDGQLEPPWQIDQGFETFEVVAKEGLRSVQPIAQRLLEQLKDEKFFLFIHTYDVHTPYEPTEKEMDLFFPNYRGGLRTPIGNTHAEAIQAQYLPMDLNDLRFTEAAYDGGIRWTDERIGQILSFISRLGLDENTIVVITSDHGESMGEHSWVAWHGYHLWEELLRVPLLFRFPDGALAGEVFDYGVGLIDVMPTLLTLLMIPADWPMQGEDLVAALEGKEAPRDHALLGENVCFDDEHRDQRVLLRGSYKFLQEFKTRRDRLSALIGRSKVFYTLRGRGLYDVARDYNETMNLLTADSLTSDAVRLAQALEDDLYAKVREGEKLEFPTPPALELTPEEEERLRGLGYLHTVKHRGGAKRPDRPRRPD